VTLTPFHIAFPVDDLEAARTFYGITPGCTEGRSSTQWIDFDLFGHQIVAHLKPPSSNGKLHHNPVDGHDVPVPHFGVILTMEKWKVLAERVSRAGVAFIIEPYIRFKGEVGEQATMFFSRSCGKCA
jgi:extradiol dioxygenase family protein